MLENAINPMRYAINYRFYNPYNTNDDGALVTPVLI